MSGLRSMPVSAYAGRHSVWTTNTPATFLGEFPTKEAADEYIVLRDKVTALEAEVERLRGEVELKEQMRLSCKTAIVQTIGGEVEGSATHEGNYLQRLRELVATEAQVGEWRHLATVSWAKDRQKLTTENATLRATLVVQEVALQRLLQAIDEGRHPDYKRVISLPEHAETDARNALTGDSSAADQWRQLVRAAEAIVNTPYIMGPIEDLEKALKLPLNASLAYPDKTDPA